MKTDEMQAQVPQPQDLNWVAAPDSTQIASVSCQVRITDGLRKPDDGTMNDLRVDADYRIVLQELMQHTSMPYLELAAVSPVAKPKLALIIDDLEQRNLVAISDRSVPTDAIVTVRARSYNQLARLIQA
jgi:hypothetical protein